MSGDNICKMLNILSDANDVYNVWFPPSFICLPEDNAIELHI